MPLLNECKWKSTSFLTFMQLLKRLRNRHKKRDPIICRFTVKMAIMTGTRKGCNQEPSLKWFAWLLMPPKVCNSRKQESGARMLYQTQVLQYRTQHLTAISLPRRTLLASCYFLLFDMPLISQMKCTGHPDLVRCGTGLTRECYATMEKELEHHFASTKPSKRQIRCY